MGHEHSSLGIKSQHFSDITVKIISKKFCNGTAVIKFGHRNRKTSRRPDAANDIPSGNDCATALANAGGYLARRIFKSF